MNYFKKINLIGGWGVFLISLVVYTLTMEPTASLWDCSEFIATSYKLEVGHPPGAPLFMMINRFFSMFAPDTASVARMVNFASVVASALTIALLFWTISHLGVRLLKREYDTMTKNESWLAFAAAFIGSMAYAFTDTFWFSAIEGEVYAQSSLFTALVYWAMLKWENDADKPHSTRWIVLVAYLMGLSIGVHLLNLLTIPALVLVFYYRKVNNKSKWGWWKAFGISIIILAFILFGLIPQIPAIGAWFDRIAVNTLGMPVNSGFLVFFILLIGALSYGIYYTHKKGRSILNTTLLCVTMIVVGYSSYVSVVVRAVANPPMNSNDPSDPYALLSFLNREQYGSTPLLNGNFYSSPAIEYNEKTTYYYSSEEKKYLPMTVTTSTEFAPGTTTFFPRMYSNQNNHPSQYKAWANIKGRNVKYNGEVINIPTFAENMTYFFNYQVRYMYWRYFLWNFVGRQNDIQGDGSVLYGNWMSGIKPIDELHLGSLDTLPDELKENKGRNAYFFLPFLLGMAGLYWQLCRDRNNFKVVMFLFLMTGLAIIIYLNQTPDQPRERDYAYAGSFYAFSIWIGLGLFGVYAVLDKLKKIFTNDKVKIATATALCLSVPIILLAENWDDHTRAGRYIARDMGHNYLETTLPNSIILPYGDNDTFPLWYNQEVEGVRTDVKISNLSYLDSDWYTNQMTERTNEAAPIDLTIPKRVFYKNNDAIPIVDFKNEYLSIKSVLDFIKDNSEAKRSMLKGSFTREISEIIPTNKIFIPVNKENAIKSGIVRAEDAHLMVDTIFIDLKSNYLRRSEYMLLDMIGTSDWSRPIYTTQPGLNLESLGLSRYIQQDGVAYRLVPIKSEGSDADFGRIDTEYLYNNLMNKFKYGNIKDPSVNVDIFIRHTLSASYLRLTSARLAKKLLEDGDKERAVKVLNKINEELPHYQLAYDASSERILDVMYAAGMNEQADEMLEDMIDYHLQYWDYYNSFDKSYFNQLRRGLQRTVFSLCNLYTIGNMNGKEEIVKDLKNFYDMVEN